MDQNKMQIFFRKLQSSYLPISVIYLIFGLCLTIKPKTFGNMICFALGLLCIIYCAINLVQYFAIPANQGRFDMALLIPIVAGIAGIIIMFWPGIIISILPTIVSIVLIVSGIIKCRNCFVLKKCGYTNWWLSLIFALISLGLGITIFINPFGTGVLFIRMVGIFFIIDGVINIYSALTMNRTGGFF